jgi:hypothetical protein
MYWCLITQNRKHADWLHLWGHIVNLAALWVLPFDYLLNRAGWHNSPALVSLGLAISVHLLSFVLQDSGKQPSLTKISSWLPYGLGKSIFLWLPVFLLPLWIASHGMEVRCRRGSATLTGLGLVSRQSMLLQRFKEYRLPLHACLFALHHQYPPGAFHLLSFADHFAHCGGVHHHIGIYLRSGH